MCSFYKLIIEECVAVNKLIYGIPKSLVCMAIFSDKPTFYQVFQYAAQLSVAF